MDKFIYIKTPTQAGQRLIEITGVSIYEKTRIREVIEHRAFLCFILRDRFKMSYQAIAKFIKSKSNMQSYHHATVINACKQYFVYRDASLDDYFLKLESHFNVRPIIKYSALSQLVGMQLKFDKLKEDHEIALEKIKKYKIDSQETYTDNEIKYRKLEPIQKKQYDERASIVLKSFNWKKPKDEYEIINCGA